MEEGEKRQIGPYGISGLILDGAGGTFYRARLRKKDLVIQRLSNPFTTHEAREAFLARVRQLKKLKHRAIVNTIDGGFDDDYGYLVMEYFPGERFSQRIAPGTCLAPDEVKRLLSPIAGALHYAHVNHALHGNLHPGALLAGERSELLLTAFSLPGLLEDERALSYMAPEYLRGQPVEASDQYALAVMAYEWLCGRRPYEATEREALLSQQQEPPPSLTSLNGAVSPAVEHVVLRALAYDPQERFPHTQAFADHYLSALIGFPVRSTAPVTGRVSRPVASSPASSVQQPAARARTPDPAAVAPALLQRQKAPESERNSETGEEAGNGETIVEESISAEREDGRPTDASHEQSHDQRSGTDSLDTVRLQSIIEADLRQGGILSRNLPGYEERPVQIEMANVVARSLTRGCPAIIEAGTGTGKSLAYLVPIVRSDKVALVSTANKALQEQLFYKDIPFIQKHIKYFEAALVKGVSNYLCLDRLHEERTGLLHLSQNREFARLLTALNDPPAGFTGDFETLDFALSADVRSRVAADGDQCAWSKCSFFFDCYVRQMRERAERARIIVVNHTLLLLDAAMDGFLLPERDVIVLDEAHHLEEEATRAFTTTVSPARITTLLAQRMLKDHSSVKLQDEALKAAHTAWARLEYLVDLGKKGRANLSEPFQEGLRLATTIADLADSLRRLRPRELPDKESQLYDKLLKRTQNLADDIRKVFAADEPDKYVYYIERVENGGARKDMHLQASAAPLDVTGWLREQLFDKCNVICTSATLATVGAGSARAGEKGPGFSYFRRRVGLDPASRSDVLECILPLAFDYENHALLYLPRDLPAPTFGEGADDYMKAIAREMYRLVKISRGRAFLLFSSKRMLDRAYELMAPHLTFPLLKQGDMTRLELTRRFRREEGAILFGLKSFWEGVDIAGDALSLVVIDKLPFDPPDDPVHEARIARMKAAGENWFSTYVLPQAVLRLKQGLGRLLRTREDRGVMAILDTRLHTKGYGRLVLDALPPARRTASLRDVERFFVQGCE
ncbi:MAG: protein kinase [Ktedonobacteraceae bacterium]|nr:protein kinase [Ktedonobacteraceae bacterium]